MDELEEITGMDGKTVYAKTALRSVLYQMAQRYGDDVTDQVFIELFVEFHGADVFDEDE